MQDFHLENGSNDRQQRGQNSHCRNDITPAKTIKVTPISESKSDTSAKQNFGIFLLRLIPTMLNQTLASFIDLVKFGPPVSRHG